MAAALLELLTCLTKLRGLKALSLWNGLWMGANFVLTFPLTMTNFLLPCYNNTDRPDVEHSSVTVRIFCLFHLSKYFNSHRSSRSTYWDQTYRPRYSPHWKWAQLQLLFVLHPGGYGRTSLRNIASRTFSSGSLICEWLWEVRQPHCLCMKKSVPFFFHRMILNDLESNKLQKDLHDAQLQEWIDRSRVAVTEELGNQRELFLNHLPFHVCSPTETSVNRHIL